jgi:hypothetical protein
MVVATDALYFIYIEACFALTSICLLSVTGIFKMKETWTIVVLTKHRKYISEAKEPNGHGSYENRNYTRR